MTLLILSVDQPADRRKGFRDVLAPETRGFCCGQLRRRRLTAKTAWRNCVNRVERFVVRVDIVLIVEISPNERSGNHCPSTKLNKLDSDLEDISTAKFSEFSVLALRQCLGRKTRVFLAVGMDQGGKNCS